MTKKQHVHAEVIKAWADGEEIEFCRPNETTWQPAPDPAFIEDYLYRVKPARSYPETLMTRSEASKLHADGIALERPSYADDVLSFINAGLRHALDAGQVVTREEFALAIGDRDKRDMAVAQAAASAMRSGTKLRGTIVWFPVLDLNAIVAEAIK